MIQKGKKSVKKNVKVKIQKEKMENVQRSTQDSPSSPKAMYSNDLILGKVSPKEAPVAPEPVVQSFRNSCT